MGWLYGEVWLNQVDQALMVGISSLGYVVLAKFFDLHASVSSSVKWETY